MSTFVLISGSNIDNSMGILTAMSNQSLSKYLIQVMKMN